MIEDFSVAVKIINAPGADKLIQYRLIKAPASPSVSKIISDFDEIVLRDTKGFLDDKIDGPSKQQGFTLQDAGLDGIHACIWRSSRNNTVSNLARGDLWRIHKIYL